MNNRELKIDPKFRDKIPPLTDEEFKQLEENIVEDGEIYEPIITWNGVIIDGHNRYKIAQKHPEIKWRTREMDFADDWAAFDWMYRKQLGRRNLTDEQRTYMIGKMYEARKNTNAFKGNQYTAKSGSAQNGPNQTTRRIRQDEVIGKEFGIGHNSVRRAEKFSKGIDALKKVAPGIADKVLSGKTNVTKKDIAAIATVDPELQQQAAQAIENGEKLPAMTNTPKKSVSHISEDKSTKSNYGCNDDSECEEEHSGYNINDFIDEYKENAKDFISNLKFLKRARFCLFDNTANRKKVCNAIIEIEQWIDKIREEYKNGE